MILDYENLMADDQTVAQAAGTTSLTNVIDLGHKGIGGKALKLRAIITEALASAGNPTLTINIFSGTTASLGTTLFSSAALTSAVAVAGYCPPQLNVSLPANCDRYIGGNFTIGTATTTAGKLTIGIVEDFQTNDDPVALGLTS